MTPNYLMGKEAAEQAAKDLKESFSKNGGQGDFVAHAVKVIASRLQKRPKQYLEYGMYWSGLKAVLNKHGSSFGEDLLDDETCKHYCYDDDATTIAAAEAFKDFYRETWARGTRKFTVFEGDGQTIALDWSLYDSDMESLS